MGHKIDAILGHLTGQWLDGIRDHNLDSVDGGSEAGRSTLPQEWTCDPVIPMSAIGAKRTFGSPKRMTAFGVKQTLGW
jgi:hypothetical protein